MTPTPKPCASVTPIIATPSAIITIAVSAVSCRYTVTRPSCPAATITRHGACLRTKSTVCPKM